MPGQMLFILVYTLRPWYNFDSGLGSPSTNLKGSPLGLPYRMCVHSEGKMIDFFEGLWYNLFWCSSKLLNNLNFVLYNEIVEVYICVLAWLPVYFVPFLYIIIIFTTMIWNCWPICLNFVENLFSDCNLLVKLNVLPLFCSRERKKICSYFHCFTLLSIMCIIRKYARKIKTAQQSAQGPSSMMLLS
jgi:hypothetical protein